MNRAAVEFMAQHAGYATPPGRMICAWELAEAEALAEALGWRVDWELDEDADLSWCDLCTKAGTERDYSPRGREHQHFLYVAVLKDSRGKVLDTLGGIDFGPGEAWSGSDPWRSPYRRVVEAELALGIILGQ